MSGAEEVNIVHIMPVRLPSSLIICMQCILRTPFRLREFGRRGGAYRIICEHVGNVISKASKIGFWQLHFIGISDGRNMPEKCR
jgi:hypothetical protein